MGHLAAAAELIEKEAKSIATSGALVETSKAAGTTRSARQADDENQSHTSDSSDVPPADQTAPTAAEAPPPRPEPLDNELKHCAVENGV